VYDADVIRPLDKPVWPEGGLAVLRGNLAPAGAVVKHAAAEPRFHRHTGPAVVFDGYQDLQRRINDESLPITPDTVLVLRGAGPHGGPGMPEYGMLPIPDRLLKQGVRDMLRISDARMSGTSYGACVLHVAPESHIGGPLALVRDGDQIELDVPGRKLTLKVSDEELAKRRKAWTPPKPHYTRGFGTLYLKHVTQANEGCDFDFLEAGAATTEPEIH
jgi:dihydroxy-acid dehydratase